MLVRCLLWPKSFKLPARAAVRCPFSEQAKHPLLASQFFMLGPRSTVGPSKPASKLFVTGLSQIQKLQALLQEKGQRLLKKYRQDQLCSQLSSLSQKGEVKQYLQVYGSLVEVVEKSQIQGEQTYNIIGWYNMTPLKRTLVQKLFQGRLQELPMLIESLSWMNSTQGSIEDFFLSKDEYQEKSRTFYRKIPYSLTIDQLKKIDNILKPTSYLDQRKFYQYYLRRNLQKILRDAHSSRDSQFGDDIVWLLEASVKAMNDCQISLSKVEKFLLTWRPKLSPSSLGKLINVYCQLGKNNPFLYEAYLKPYLQQQLKQPAGAISALKFIVSSQTQDKVLLHSCCQHINLSFNSSALSEAQLSQLHTYLHYLQISGEGTNLHKELEKKLHVGCSQQNCIPSINSLVLGQKANKPTVSKMKTSKAKYISECLQEEAERKIAKFEISEKDEFKEEIGFKLPGTNFTQLDIYTNLTFCNFQLQYFLYNRVKNEVVNVETRCEAYIFSSGRLRRSVEMRDQILEHYGITVKHVNTRKYLNKGLKLSQEEQMMVSKRQKKVKS